MICTLATTPPKPVPIAANAGFRRRRVPEEPLARWIELMELIEGLSPRWPPRMRTLATGDFRL